MKNKYDRHHMPFGNAFAIADPLVLSVLEQPLDVTSIIQNTTVHTEFLEKYQQWVLTTKNNTIQGLDNFKYACFSNGTTEAFDKFYAKYSSRRFRFFKGEYVYHRLSCRNNNFNWAYLDDERLTKNDAVIISLPFSDTGNKHKDMDALMHNCSAMGIPVLLDCAYLGVCSRIDFNFNHECIKEVTFSLSKSLYAAHLRIGMRLTREDDDDPLFVTNKIGYVNKLSCYLGLQLIEKFSPDYIYNKYREKQIEICNILDVEPSNCVLFGIGDNNWDEYNRDRETNRLSFHKFLNKDSLEEIRSIKNEKR